MTLTDIIILIVIIGIIGLILYNQFKHKDESICASCSYAKGCTEKIAKKKAS
ncbi:MAG: FeoB-associated Cys-rich membrane protein [Acholeplasmataceae bacterium]|nr:FeoB-associated Cys-rich membrane protein [Acholeplasmataceae bacterium]